MNVIAHNMAAINAQRQLGITAKSSRKNVEKLSSGYKINRAADDAAGLAISEKMRRQIRGLDQGIRNTQEGISLCQVADGALAEVDEMLHRMTELSVKAANGTLVAEDREAIEKEIGAIKMEINRISTSTTFNERLLFSGKKSTGSSTPGGIGTVNPPVSGNISFPTGQMQRIDNTYLSGLSSSVIDGVTHYQLNAGIYEIDSSISNVVFDVSGETVIQNSVLQNVSLNCSPSTKLYIDNLSITNEEAFSYDAIGYNGINNMLTFRGSNSLQAFYGAAVNVSAGEELTIEGDGILSASSKQGAGIGGSYAGQSNIDRQPHDYGKITINSGVINASSHAGAGIGSSMNPVLHSNGNLIINGGTISAVSSIGAGIGTGWEYTVTGYNSALAAGSSGRVTINGGNVTAYADDSGAGIGGSISFGGADVTINGGTVHASSCDYPNGAGIGSGAMFMTTMNINGNTVSFDENNYNFADYPINRGSLTLNGGEVTALGGEVSEKGAAYPVGIGALLLTNAVPDQIANDYFAEYKSSVSIEGVSTTTDQLSLGTENGRYKYYWQGRNSGTGGNTGNQGAATIQDTGEIWIQSGYEAGDGLYITIGEMNTDCLGLDTVSCKTQGEAANSLTQIADALERISRQRSTIGAQQNRLEHIVKNESNIVENTTASESAIRDADMAEEMVGFSKNNILEKVGEAMLSQANQSNQGVLSLLS